MAIASGPRLSDFWRAFDWLPKSMRFRAYDHAARADYFLVVLADFEAAVAASQYEPTPIVREILSRIPPRSSAQSGAQYQEFLGTTITWADCFVLERACVDAFPERNLVANLRRQRTRYAQMASADEYGAYAKSALDLDGAAPAAPASDRLRSELGLVVDRIVYLLTVSAPKENTRAWLLIWTILLMACGAAAIVGSYFALWHAAVENDPNLKGGAFVPSDSLFVVLFAGLVGGFVSVNQRLQAPSSVDPMYKRLELGASGLSLIVSPVIGMIFAGVLFVAIMGNLVTSGIFPTFVCPIESHRCGGHDLAAFSAGSTPSDVASWAKLALWSFAAGFLERLVPDILTRLGTIATDATSSK